MRKPSDIFDKCESILIQRGEQYGDHRVLGNIMAQMMGAQVRADMSCADAMMVMAQLKMARLAMGDDKSEDSYIDAINYLALAWASEENE